MSRTTKFVSTNIQNVLAVVFEVETGLIKSLTHPHSEFEVLEFELTDYLPLTGCTQRHIADMSVSYMNA